MEPLIPLIGHPGRLVYTNPAAPYIYNEEVTTSYEGPPFLPITFPEK